MIASHETKYTVDTKSFQDVKKTTTSQTKTTIYDRDWVMNFDPLLIYIEKQHSINIFLFYLTFYDFYKDCKKRNCWSMFISIEKTWIGNKQKLITLWNYFWGMFYQNRLDSIQLKFSI